MVDGLVRFVRSETSDTIGYWGAALAIGVVMFAIYASSTISPIPFWIFAGAGHGAGDIRRAQPGKVVSATVDRY